MWCLQNPCRMFRSNGGGPLFPIALIIASFLIIYLLSEISDLKEELDLIDQKNCTDGTKPSGRLLRLYRKQATERRRIFHSVEKSDNKYGKIYNNLVPEVHCAEKVKIGSTDDGGKWMCGPFSLPKDCVIYSLGMRNDIQFEEEMQKISRQRCEIHSFDSKKQDLSTVRRLKEIRATARVATIGKTTDMDKGVYSMEDLLRMHSVTEIEILKMDIEGAELDLLEEFLDTNTISQILVEVHGRPYEVVQLLRGLSDRGYLLFHFEVNGAHPKLCEYSFIHKSALRRYGAVKIARYLN